MKEKIIHGFKVEYDEESDTVKSYLEHLENHLSHEELKNFFEDAERSSLRKVHLEDNHEHKVTMEYKDYDSCLIRKRKF